MMPKLSARPDRNSISPDAVILKRWRWLDWLSPGLALALLIALAIWPSIAPLSGSTRIILTFVFMWIGVASSWNFVGGYTGYTDLGHTVFFGIGGYTAGILMAHLAEWPFWAAAIAAMLVSAAFAVLVGWPTLRLRGAYFAVAMLGLFVATREVTLNLKELTNGGEGISFRNTAAAAFMSPQEAYYAFLGIAGLVFFLSLWIYRTQLGKVLRSIRDDETAADMRGIDTTRIKITIFALAAAITGLIGATRAYQNAYIEVDIIFPVDMTAQLIMMTILGGIGRPWGPVIGAILFEIGRLTLWSQFQGYHLIITGVLLALVVLFMPRGLLSLFDPEGRGLAWRVAVWQTRQQQANLPSPPPSLPHGEGTQKTKSLPLGESDLG
jgi:branched-chain amino acid transport system permease protein